MSSAAEPTRASRPVGGLAAVVVAAAVWGTTGTATHFAPGVPAFVFGAVTFGLGGVVLAASAGRGAVVAIRDRATRGWVLLGAASLAVYAVVFYAALAGAGVALGTTIAIGSSPVFAGLVEWAAERRRVGGRWVVSAVISVLGMATVASARSEDPGAPGSLTVGIAAALLAGLTYALYSWAVARGMRAVAAPAGIAARQDRAGLVPPVGRGLVGAVFGLAAVPLVVLVAVAGHEYLADAGNWPVFLYLALVPTVLGHTLYASGLRTVSASAATLLSLLEPVVAAVLAVLVVGEHLGVTGWVGIGLVVAGLGVLALPGRTARRGP